MLYALLALIALVFATPANAQVHVDIGIHLPVPPPLVVVPGVPSVQYAPAAPANVFFYGSQYWVFANGGWHVSRRHEGPWILVAPQFVPRPVLLVPVRYYHVPPGHWKQCNVKGRPTGSTSGDRAGGEARMEGRGPDQGWERAQVRADAQAERAPIGRSRSRGSRQGPRSRQVRTGRARARSRRAPGLAERLRDLHELFVLLVQ